MSLTLDPPLPPETVAAPRSERTLNVPTVVLELTVRVSLGSNAEAAAKLLADGLCGCVGADHVVVATRGQRDDHLTLAASSDVRQLDRHTTLAQELTRLLNEPLGDEAVTWLDHHAQLAEAWQPERVAKVAFRTVDGALVAAALVAWSHAPRVDAVEPVLRLAAHAVAPVLALHERSTPLPWSTRCRATLPHWLKSRPGLAAVIAALVALVIPWPYTISADVTLEPIEHRFVSAPFEGVFEQSLVLPGDHVEAGQVLGRMDGRELRTKLAANEADQARAARSRDLNQATNKLAAAQIDRLEMERLTYERDLIERRMQQLEIRAPIAGVIVSGDLRRHTGATVSVGHTLYEVAPLGRLIAQVAIPEADIELTTTDAPLRLSFDGLTTAALVGKLERIHPRAEVRDNQQVFIGEMTVENGRGVYRPGMQGRARITGPATPGVWVLLRKPYLTLRSLVGW
jgi:multidrug resistance efflux pump